MFLAASIYVGIAWDSHENPIFSGEFLSVCIFLCIVVFSVIRLFDIFVKKQKNISKKNILLVIFLQVVYNTNFFLMFSFISIGLTLSFIPIILLFFFIFVIFRKIFFKEFIVFILCWLIFSFALYDDKGILDSIISSF
ncbi:hypothetical protein CSB11_02340 [Candidatus Campbellbacteria bacterium]|nr:MAG: hypothetical protein CSB11_02340 [Candidatus Campbellbacteria bacterium]